MGRSLTNSLTNQTGRSRFSYDGTRIVTTPVDSLNDTLSNFVDTIASFNSANLPSSGEAGTFGSLDAESLLADSLTSSSLQSEQIETGNVTISNNLDVGSISVSNNVISAPGTDMILRPGTDKQVVVDGNLEVQGDLTRVRTVETVLQDPVIALGYYDEIEDPFPTDTWDRGLNLIWTSGATAYNGFMGYSRSKDRFVFLKDATADTSGNIFTRKSSVVNTFELDRLYTNRITTPDYTTVDGNNLTITVGGNYVSNVTGTANTTVTGNASVTSGGTYTASSSGNAIFRSTAGAVSVLANDATNGVLTLTGQNTATLTGSKGLTLSTTDVNNGDWIATSAKGMALTSTNETTLTASTIHLNSTLLELSNQATNVRVLDNSSTALVFQEAGNSYLTLDTSNGAEKVIISQELDLDASQIDLSTQATNIELIDNSSTSLTFQQGGTDYLTLDTTNSSEKVIISQELDFNASQIDLSTQATNFELIDNSSTSLTFQQGGSDYLTLDTTNSSEKVVISQELDINASQIDLSTQATNFELIDNSATALTIQEGGNNYLTFNTTDGDERIHLYRDLDLTTQATSFNLIDNSATALAIHESGSNYLVFNTTDGDERIQLYRDLDLTTQATAINLIDNSATALSIHESGTNYLTLETTDNSEQIKVHQDLYLDPDLKMQLNLDQQEEFFHLQNTLGGNLLIEHELRVGTTEVFGMDINSLADYSSTTLLDQSPNQFISSGGTWEHTFMDPLNSTGNNQYQIRKLVFTYTIQSNHLSATDFFLGSTSDVGDRMIQFAVDNDNVSTQYVRTIWIPPGTYDYGGDNKVYLTVAWNGITLVDIKVVAYHYDTAASGAITSGLHLMGQYQLSARANTRLDLFGNEAQMVLSGASPNTAISFFATYWQASGQDTYLRIIDDSSTAFVIQENTNNYLVFDTTDGSEKVIISQDLEYQASQLDLSTQATNFELIDNSSTALTMQQGGTDYFTLDTTDGSEKVVISQELDFNATQMDLSTQAVNLAILDNSSTSLTIKEGSNDYLTFDTTDSSEKVVISQELDLDASQLDLSTQATNIELIDNSSTSLTFQQGGTDYLTLDTTNSSEKVVISQELDLDASQLDLSTQAVNFALLDNSSSSLTIKEGANSYLTFDTTDSSEKMILSQNLDIDADQLDFATQATTFLLANNNTTALQIKEGATNYLTFDTTTNDHQVIVSQTLTPQDGIDFSDQPSNIYLRDNDSSSLTILEGGTYYLTFDTTDGAEKVIISQELDFNASQMDLSSQATNFALLDNSSTSLTIKEGANSYLTFDTTNSSEKVIVSQELDFDASQLDLSTQAVNLAILDNSSTSLTIKEGTNSYLTFDTTNSSEKVIISQELDFDASQINFSTQAVNFSLVDNSATALTIKEGANNYLVFNTTDGDERIQLYRDLDLTSQATSFNLIDNSGTALAIHESGSNYLVFNTTDGDERIQLYQDLDLTSQATSFNLIDNSSTALQLHESGTSYLTLDTTDGSEKVVISQELDFDASQINFSTQAVNFEVLDNSAIALTIKQGGNTYLTIDTTDGAEAITFDQAVNFTGGLDLSGGLDFSAGASDILLTDNSSTALVFKEGSNDYLTFDTTDNAEQIKFNQHISIGPNLNFNLDLDQQEESFFLRNPLGGNLLFEHELRVGTTEVFGVELNSLADYSTTTIVDQSPNQSISSGGTWEHTFTDPLNSTGNSQYQIRKMVFIYTIKSSNLSATDFFLGSSSDVGTRKIQFAVDNDNVSTQYVRTVWLPPETYDYGGSNKLYITVAWNGITLVDVKVIAYHYDTAASGGITSGLHLMGEREFSARANNRLDLFGNEAQLILSGTSPSTTATFAVDYLQLSGQDTYLRIIDDSATAFTIQENTNNYLTFDTTNSAEKIIFSQDLDLDLDTIDCSTQATNLTILDNSSTALTIKEGANSYLTLDTTDGSEKIVISQELDLDASQLDLSSQAINIALIDNSSTALTFKEGANDYLTVDTTNGSELITFHKSVAFSEELPLGTSTYLHLGDSAGNSSTANHNVSIGPSAGGALTTGTGNVTLGHQAGDSITDGNNNIMIGLTAGAGLTSGVSNIAIGPEALLTTTGRSYQVMIGHHAGRNGTFASGSGQIGIGFESMYSVTSGLHNTAIGYQAGKLIADGSNNTILGYDAGSAMTSGERNVLMGVSSGNAITSGSHNTMLGRSTGLTLVDGDYNILLGVDVDVAASNTSNSFRVGKLNSFLLDGDLESDDLTINGDVTIDNTYSNSSGSLTVQGPTEISDTTGGTTYVASHALEVDGSARVAKDFWVGDGYSMVVGAGLATGTERLRLRHLSTNSYIEYGTSSLLIQDNDGDTVMTLSNTETTHGQPVIHKYSAQTSLSGSVTLSFRDGNNFHLTYNAGGSVAVTLANPNWQVAGQSGEIIIQTNGTNNTIAFGTDWKFRGGVAPVLSTTDTIDIISYYVLSSGNVLASFAGDFK